MSLQIRRDPVFVSSVLLTLTFLLLVPFAWRAAQSGAPLWHFGKAAHHDRELLDSMQPGFQDLAILLGQVGTAGLAVILISLIVIWKAYVKKLRWAWFVMLIIVWGWYFPFFMMQDVEYARGFVGSLLFSRWSWMMGVMLVALVVPVRSFLRNEAGTQSR